MTWAVEDRVKVGKIDLAVPINSDMAALLTQVSLHLAVSMIPSCQVMAQRCQQHSMFSFMFTFTDSAVSLKPPGRESAVWTTRWRQHCCVTHKTNFTDF
jgi:hypothetical protein